MGVDGVAPYRLVKCTSVQRGLPLARHERHFAEHRAGFAYRIVVELELRIGLRGPFDRVVVKRLAGQTIRKLERRFAELSARDDERPMGVRSR